ncbi:hypothetical protein JJE66_16180 [Bradyrhizobium diazoefficiens]|nr:hypothetical protein [Bradyrhizobium diazoefficiens]
MCPVPDGPYAQEVAKFAGTHHTEIMLSSDELMDGGVRASTLHSQDLPLTGGDLDGAVFLLFKAIRQHSKVALSGEIADELFGGYSCFTTSGESRLIHSLGRGTLISLGKL